jgi:hypothetical protein
MCAIEAWLWKHEEARQQFVRSGGLQLFLDIIIDPEYHLVTGSVKNVVFYCKDDVKKLVKTVFYSDEDLIESILTYINTSKVRF